MATKFEIKQRSLINKLEKIDAYFQKWNMSVQQVYNISDKYHLRQNLVKASWGQKFGSIQNGKTPIQTRIEQVKNAKSMADLEMISKEVGSGSIKDFLNFQVTKTNNEAWIESISDKFGQIYNMLNKFYKPNTVNAVSIYIEELRMNVEDLDALSISYEQIAQINEYINLFYEDIQNKDQSSAKTHLLKIARIIYNNKQYSRFERIMDSYL